LRCGATRMCCRLMRLGGRAGPCGWRGARPRRGPQRRHAAGQRCAAERPDRLVIDWPWRSMSVLELPDAGGTLELKARSPRADRSGRASSNRNRPPPTGRRASTPRGRGGPRRTLKTLLQESHLPIGEARAPSARLFRAQRCSQWVPCGLTSPSRVTPGTAHRGRFGSRSPRPRARRVERAAMRRVAREARVGGNLSARRSAFLGFPSSTEILRIFL